MSGPDEKRSPKRAALFGALLVVVALSLVTRWATGREFGVTWKEAPPETRGVWTTTDTRYAGRAIEVAAGSVVLRLGDEGQAVYGSLDIARERFDNDVRVLRLEYGTDVGPDALDIVLTDARTMHLANQPDIVWTVERDPGFVAALPPPVADQPGRGGSFSSRLLSPDLLGGLALLVLAAGLIVLRRTSGGEAPALSGPGAAPMIIRGVWTTQDSRFEGQSIRIAPGYGFSQFGPGDTRIGGPIESVQEWKEDGNRVVSVQYRSPDGVSDLDMAIDRSGHMRLRDGPKSVWVKREP